MWQEILISCRPPQIHEGEGNKGMDIKSIMENIWRSFIELSLTLQS